MAVNVHASPFLFNNNSQGITYENYLFLNFLFKMSLNFTETKDIPAEIYTKLTGVSHFQTHIEPLFPLQGEMKLSLQKKVNCYMVYSPEMNPLGYLPKEIGEMIDRANLNGARYRPYLSAITGGKEHYIYGVKVRLVREIELDIRKEWLKCPDNLLKNRIKESIIGKHDFLPKQTEVFNEIHRHKNVLAVFPTGRGKSALFQFEAIYRALRKGKTTVIVYPLKALINDQFQYFQESFKEFGLKILKFTGALTPQEKDTNYKLVKTQNVDIILTTPEFIYYNLKKFEAINQQIDLFVIDEAHHMADDYRFIYQELGEVIAYFNHPQVMALTATADDDTTEEIVTSLGIDQIVVDHHQRDNLELHDLRDCFNSEEKVSYIINNLKWSKGKSIIYVGTQKQAVELAQIIHQRLPALAYRICFYHSGMSAQDKIRIEKMFKANELKVIVSTSAFGEGVNIIDISDVFFTSFPYGYIDLNQQSGRAGRNGAPAHIHLLFNDADFGLNYGLLKSQVPGITQLRLILMFIQQNNYIDIQELKHTLIDCGNTKYNPVLVENALKILQELKLITLQNNKVVAQTTKTFINLQQSHYYNGIKLDMNKYMLFKSEILMIEKEALLDKIKKPLTPLQIQNHLAKAIS